METSIPRQPAGVAPRARQRGFLDFSFLELAIIFGVALVVLGPKKLPGLVSQLGRWAGRARMMARQFRDQWEQEVNQIQSIKPVHYRPPNPAPAPPGGTEHTQPAQTPAQPATDAGAPPDAGPSPPATGANSSALPDPWEGVPQFALHGTQPVVVEPQGAAPAAAAQEAPAATAGEAHAGTAEDAAGAAAASDTPAGTSGERAPSQTASPAKVVFPPHHE